MEGEKKTEGQIRAENAPGSYWINTRPELAFLLSSEKEQGNTFLDVKSRLGSIALIHFLPFAHLNIEFCDFHGKIGDFAVFPLHHPPCLSSVYLNYPRNERKRTQQVSLFIGSARVKKKKRFSWCLGGWNGHFWRNGHEKTTETHFPLVCRWHSPSKKQQKRCRDWLKVPKDQCAPFGVFLLLYRFAVAASR